MKENVLSPSEAVYGFAGWLTSRRFEVRMSAHDNAAIVAELVHLFNEYQGFEEPREGWEKAIVRVAPCEKTGTMCAPHARPWPCIDVDPPPDYAMYLGIIQAAEPALDYILAVLKHNPPVREDNFKLLAATATNLHRKLYPNKEPPVFTFRTNITEPALEEKPAMPTHECGDGDFCGPQCRK